MIRDRLRHTKRYRQIINAFIKNGFGHVMFRVGLADRKLTKGKESIDTDPNMKDVGKRLRHALQNLGPTFIKIGQIASTRYDVLPPEVTHELEKLQERAPAIPFEDVKSTIESELGGELGNLFASIDSEPLATASLGQVHTVKLLTGEDAAVKVQRPNIHTKVGTDLEILEEAGHILEEHTSWASQYRLSDIIGDLSGTLNNELDYLREGRAGERIAAQFEDQKAIKFPAIYWEYTTKKVLTMEKIKGVKVSNNDLLDEKGYNRKVIAERLADSMLRQLLEHGFFHADPHSGNIYVLPENTVAFLDFGETGQISDKLRQHFASIIVNLHQGDTKAMMKTFDRMDIIGKKTDRDNLERDLKELHDSYEHAKTKDMGLSHIIVGVFDVAYHNDIEFPVDLVMISKVILTLEGVLGRLDPGFNLMHATEPFAKQLLREKYHPGTIFRESMEELGEDAEILRGMPKDLKEVMEVIKQGKIGLDINVKRENSIMRRFDKISNRLSFSILMLAFSILMAGLIIGFAIMGRDSIIWDLPVIEIGAVITALMFIVMVIIIIRSGRM